MQQIASAGGLLGIDHVALGSDFDGTVRVPFDAAELAILTQTMLEQGFTETQIRKVMGSNAQRFLLAWLPKTGTEPTASRLGR